VLTFSARTRTDNLTRMAEDPVDVLVIGGGITGVGIALDAASRGLTVALVEKDDYAAGTSGRSSRLVHGGLRYLEHGELGLVRESLRERGILYRLAPHLVRPVPMYMLASGLRRRMTYRAGLTVYEALAAGRNIGYHQAASADQVASAIPGLGERTRGVRYFECQTDDARLTIEVARTAHAYGARLANHARVTALLGAGRVTGAAVTDELTGERFEVRAKVVVNATGVWAAEVAALAGQTAAPGISLSPSKGVHLVFAPGAVQTTAAMVAPAADGRYVFIVPWEDRVYAGTTDTPYDGDLDSPTVTDADREYILSAVTPLFPGVSGRDVVASWAGLRPLAAAESDKTADLSRQHKIFDEPPGLLTITGGKLTTYRAMAQDLVDRVAADLGQGDPCRTRDIPLGRRLARGRPADPRGPVAGRAGRGRAACPGRRADPGPQPRDGPDRLRRAGPADPADHPRRVRPAHTFSVITAGMMPNEAGVTPTISPSASTGKGVSASTRSWPARSSAM
jgi:glycerol-3-phosphate dehydrogenase